MTRSTDRRPARLLAGAVLALCTLGTAQGAPDGEPLLLDRIVAVVDEGAIMLSELEERTALIRRQMGDRRPPEEALRRQVLERLVVDRIQLQQAAQLGIRVDDLTLNRTMQQLAASNGVDLEGFREALIADGIDYERFREQIRDEITISRLRQRVVESRISVSDDEIDDFIAMQSASLDPNVEYRLAQILIALPEAASPEQIGAARERAEALRARIEAGAGFADLAVQESQGQRALEGGDLGWRAAGELPTLFARVVPLMEVGAVSEPIRSPSGFHLVQLTDRRGEARNLVRQTRARHILITPNALLSDEEARLRLASLRRRIQGGEDFAALARANSDDRGSAAEGGDLGWADPGNFVAEFETVMNSLLPGELSEPFRSQFGWHMVQVLERREIDTAREQTRAQARESLRQRKLNEELELWLRRIRDEAFVEFRLDQTEPPARRALGGIS
jgi:peptidyl-prolyl cis-trans isomerase SurA